MEKFFRLVRSTGDSSRTLPVTLRCPACHMMVTLNELHNRVDSSMEFAGHYTGTANVGYRVCPNAACRLFLTVVYSIHLEHNVFHAKLVAAVPRERIDFDAAGIPASIVNSLEEAITCHADGCYVAGAIMVRKTVEELCREKGASGTRLIDQIRDLSNHVIVPPGLLAGVDNLRLLGNDAAHIELKHYDKITSEEVEVGILFTKELLKAVYQSAQLADRLAALKKSPPSP